MSAIGRPTLIKPVGVVEQLQVTAVPRHQLEGLVHHADALGDVFDGALQQGPVELQHFRGFVGDAYHVLQLHVPTFNRGLYHRASRRGAEYTGQQAFGVGDPIVIGILVGVEAFALAIGEADKALLRTFFADKTCGQAEQVADLYRQHGASAGALADFLADKAPGLPVLGHPGARQHRDPDEQREVARQGEHRAQGQRGERQAERVGMQPRSGRGKGSATSPGFSP